MKDKIVSWIRLVVGWWLLWYIAYLYMHGLIVTKNAGYNLIVLGFIWLIAFWILFMWIRPVYIKRFKTMQVLFWVFLIIFSQLLLLDNPSSNVFLGDIIKVLWVFMIIIGPTWFCIPEKIKKQVEESKIEIIEV